MKNTIIYLVFGILLCGSCLSGCAKENTEETPTTCSQTDETERQTETQTEQDEATMDPVLHKAICEALGYEADTELTDEDYLNVTSISIFYEDIYSIEGISKLANLTSISISGGNITDISELAKLPNIQFIDIYQNLIVELPDFSQCRELTEVHLAGNLIEDISSLSENYVLTYVDVSNNRISSIGAIGDNTAIESLSIDSNCILDYASISDNENLIDAINNGSQTTYDVFLETERLAQSVVETFSKNLSELELEKYIYQYVIDNMEYEVVYRDGAAFGYYALKDGVGVCGDYAELFCILANHAGLEAYVCSSETHAWNTVVIDGVTYHCDTLWDEGQEEWIYFNLSGEEIGKVEDHSFDERRY